MSRLARESWPLLFSSIAYAIVIIVFAFVLSRMQEPWLYGFVAGALIASGYGVGHLFTDGASSSFLRVFGAIAVSTIIAFPMFFVVVMFGWIASLIT